MRTRGILVMVMYVLTVSVQAADPDTTEGGILKDDPILAALDSLAVAKFFESSAFSTDRDLLNLRKWSEDTVPVYNGTHYARAIGALDKKTPFHLVFNEPVNNYIHAYVVKNREKVSRMMGLAELYFPLFEEMLDRYDLPLEFKYLAIVESALNPNARSRSGAVGLWQFMYRTGKIYNLNSTSYLDERRDPYKATEAACEYFRFLHGMFGNWELVLAAYNGGPGTVSKAIRRSGGKRDYWEIRPYLSVETRGYVPAFIAVNYVMNHAADHNIFPVKPAFFRYELDTVVIKKHTNLQTLASVLQMPYSEIAFLNPIYRRSIVPETPKGLPLLLPKDKVGIFLSNASSIYELDEEKFNTAYANPSAAMKESRNTHRVRYGETLGSIASKYRVRVNDLRDWNGIRGNLIREGQRLVVYSRVANTTSSSSSSVSATTSKDGRYHVVQGGDTLWDIAKRNGITVERLKELNNINNHYQLKIGTKLRIG